MTPLARIRAAAATAVAVLSLLGAAPAAFAHATLEETTPANATVVVAAPSSVELRFSEQVETALGSVRVFDSRLRRVDAGGIRHVGGDRITAGLRAGLPKGTYTVAWRVVSADSHPVHGAFVFHVGAESVGDPGIALGSLPGSSPPSWIDPAFGVIRFVGFVVMLLVVGGVVALGWVIPAAFDDQRRRLARWTLVLAGLLALVTLPGLPLQAAAAGGTGLGEALDPTALRALAGTAFGEAWLLRALSALAVAGALAFGFDRLRPLAAVLVLVLAGTPALAGHARVEGPLVIGIDTLHVVAASAWVGCLAMLLATLWKAGARRWELAATAVPRFSAVAVVSVGGLIVAGTVNAYLQTRSTAALTDTSYGRLVLLKVGLLVPVLAMAAITNRRSTPALRSGDATPALRRRFVQLASAEVGLVVVVLALTAVLVAEPPGRVAVAAAAGPVSATAVAGPFEVNVVVDPARTGANAVHLYLLDPTTGQPASADEAVATATLPAAALGPLPITLTPAGPGHYVATAAALPVAGQWRLTVGARVGEFDQYDTTIDILVKAN
jgi:copper transport protein